MPKLKQIHADYKDKGVVVVGIHTKNSMEKMPAFVEQQKIEYAVCVDETNETRKRFGVDAFPTYVVLDKKGVVRSLGHAAPSHDDLDKLVGEK